MTGGQYAALLGLWVAGIVVPGPDIFLILRNAFLSSRRSALFTALGVMVGNVAWITLSLLGVTVLVSGNPVLKLVVQVGGALFLARMGYGAGLASRAAAPQGVTVPHDDDAEAQPLLAEDRAVEAELASQGRGRFLGPEHLTPWRALAQGTVTNLANAKAVVFFVALFGSVVPTGIAWWETLTVLGMLVAVGLAWFLAVAWVGSIPALARRFQAHIAEVEIVSGVVFLLVAVGLLAEVLLGV